LFSNSSDANFAGAASAGSTQRDETAHALQLRGVRKTFGGFVAVDVESLDISRLGVSALIGPNGAGKTTLFDLISGFLQPTSGSIHYRGENISGRPAQWRSRHGLVRTFQLTRTFDRMTVLENMVIGAMPAAHFGLARSVLTPWLALKRERETEERARELLEWVGLSPVINLYARSLSGGQKKLLEFARALMSQPQLLLLDEPMAGVNPTVRERMITLIREYVDRGNGVLFVEHDLPRVMQLADQVIVLDRGRVIAEGTPEVITADSAVIQAYLGGGANAELKVEAQ
jgi:ABC-type branched-subunit amino acid transport system ATPase component